MASTRRSVRRQAQSYSPLRHARCRKALHFKSAASRQRPAEPSHLDRIGAHPGSVHAPCDAALSTARIGAPPVAGGVWVPHGGAAPGEPPRVEVPGCLALGSRRQAGDDRLPVPMLCVLICGSLGRRWGIILVCRFLCAHRMPSRLMERPRVACASVITAFAFGGWIAFALAVGGGADGRRWRQTAGRFLPASPPARAGEPSRAGARSS